MKRTEHAEKCAAVYPGLLVSAASSFAPVPLFENDFTRSSRIIYTPSVFARASLFYLQEAGRLTALHPHVSSRANLASYLFFAVTDGEGTLHYAGRQYMLQKGDCVFLDCRRGYRMCASEHRDAAGRLDRLWSLAWLHFDGISMRDIYRKYMERGGLPVFACGGTDGARFSAYTALHQAVFETAASDSYVRDMELAEKLTALIRMLMADAWDEQKAGGGAAKRMDASGIRAYIDAHYTERISLDVLAKQYFISKEYLAKIFKEQYGFTVNGYILHVRISRAKNLLRFGSDAQVSGDAERQLTVEEIGQMCGFPDANYFARCFKKVEGISPSAYRESW